MLAWAAWSSPELPAVDQAANVPELFGAARACLRGRHIHMPLRTPPKPCRRMQVARVNDHRTLVGVVGGRSLNRWTRTGPDQAVGSGFDPAFSLQGFSALG